MMKAVFYFKVFGLTEDENGESGYGYLRVAPMSSNGGVCEVSEDEYDEVKFSMKAMVSNQLRVGLTTIEDSTEEEYLAHTEVVDEPA